MHLKESYFDESSFSDETINNSLAEAIYKHKKGAAILFELPVESYFFANTVSLKYLTNN